MRIYLIVALDERDGIGHHGRLPWRLATDLRRFKSLTLGHHLVMGRKTWEAIGRPLPGRVMIVVTRKRDYQAPGCYVVHSLQAALDFALSQGEQELFIIGGGELFRLALPIADRIYLTRVHTLVPADVFFPTLDFDEWEVILAETIPPGEKDEFSTTYSILERRESSKHSMPCENSRLKDLKSQQLGS